MSKNIFLYFLLLIMTLLGALGGYFFKKATTEIFNLKSLILCKALYIGGSLYFISALLNIFLLKYFPYALVLPLTSVTYIWTLLLSNKLLKEKINLNKKIGIIFIIIGAILISIN